ncbi:hypothetical protein BC628DRAFT_235424 [Trametes gibbosa]|nr:hypothetical protein BC628DRAFT_235424 [Trametes gibbosa]
MPKGSEPPTKKRDGNRAIKPYARPLGDSTSVNRKASPSTVASSSSAEEPLAKKLHKGERLLRMDLGMPTREEYAGVEEEYLASLDLRKKAKALISQKMFDNIWLVIHYPDDLSIETPQFRWWVRKMFTTEAGAATSGAGAALPQEVNNLNGNGSARILLHGGKRVAVKEKIYDILCFCHDRADHGGRDRTAVEVRKRYTWIPKELIAGFVRSCPTCICRRTGKYDEDRIKREEPVSGAYLAEEYANWDHNNNLQPQRSIATNSSVPVVDPRSQLVPLRDFSSGPTLGSVPTTNMRGAHGVPGPHLHLKHGSIPWYIPPTVSGPQLGPSSTAYDPETVSGSFAHVLSVLGPGPRWQIPGSTQGLPNHPSEHFRLPSIHTCGKTLRPQTEGNIPKVILPPLAQLLASEQMAPRRPFGAIHNNTHPELRGFSIRAQSHAPYVPQIDPALLPDGVHMLALAAEAAKAREAACQSERAGVA